MTAFIKLLFLISIPLFSSCRSITKSLNNDKKSKSFKIAFGSCADQDKNIEILGAVCKRKPDLFVFLGDNIYGDTEDMSILKSKYDKLGSKSYFKKLKKKVPIMATWDDHDYGENDAGKNYPKKEESKEIFLDFWNIPDNSNRRLRNGIYGSTIFNFDSIKIQLILLDTRTFRDNLTKTTNKTIYKNKYQPTISPDSTFLGSDQWLWLEQKLKVEADIRIIASSNQFSAEYTGWESWTNVPYERKKMLTLIKSTKANGVLFISGDMHYGEISKYTNKDTYPVYDITSSSLSKSWRVASDNKNRLGNAVIENNFGMLEIIVDKTINIRFNLINKLNIVVVKYQINLSDITF